MNFRKCLFSKLFIFCFTFQQILLAAPLDSSFQNDVLAPRSGTGELAGATFPSDPKKSLILSHPKDPVPFEMAYRLPASYVEKIFDSAIEKDAFAGLSDEDKGQMRETLKKAPLASHHLDGTLSIHRDIIDVLTHLEWYSKGNQGSYREIKKKLFKQARTHEGMQRALRSYVDFDVLDEELKELFSSELTELFSVFEKEYVYSFSNAAEDKEKRKEAIFRLLSDLVDKYGKTFKLRRGTTELHILPDSLRKLAIDIFAIFEERGAAETILKNIQNSTLEDHKYHGIFPASVWDQIKVDGKKVLGILGEKVFKRPTEEERNQIEKGLTYFKSAKGLENRKKALENLIQIPGLGLDEEKVKSLLKYCGIEKIEADISPLSWEAFKHAFLSHLDPSMQDKRVALIGESSHVALRSLENLVTMGHSYGLQLALSCGKNTAGQYDVAIWGEKAPASHDKEQKDLEEIVSFFDWSLLGIEALIVEKNSYTKLKDTFWNALRKKGIEIYVLGEEDVTKFSTPFAYATRSSMLQAEETKSSSALLYKMPLPQKKVTHLATQVIHELLGKKEPTFLTAEVETVISRTSTKTPPISSSQKNNVFPDFSGKESSPQFVSYRRMGDVEKTCMDFMFYVKGHLDKEEIRAAFQEETSRNGALFFSQEGKSSINVTEKGKIVFLSDTVKTEETLDGTTLVRFSLTFDDKAMYLADVMGFISGKIEQIFPPTLGEDVPKPIGIGPTPKTIASRQTEKLAKKVRPLVRTLKQEGTMEKTKKELKKIFEKHDSDEPGVSEKLLSKVQKLTGKISASDLKIKVLKNKSKEVVGIVLIQQMVGGSYHLHASSLLVAEEGESTASVQKAYYDALKALALSLQNKNKVTVFDVYKPEKKLRAVFEISGKKSIHFDRWEQFSNQEKITVLCKSNLKNLKPLGGGRSAVVLNGESDIGLLASQIIMDEGKSTPNSWIVGFYGCTIDALNEIMEKKFPGEVSTGDGFIKVKGKQLVSFTGQNGVTNNPIFSDISNYPFISFLFAGIPLKVIEGKQSFSIPSCSECISDHLALVLKTAVYLNQGLSVESSTLQTFADEFQTKKGFISLKDTPHDSLGRETVLVQEHITEDNFKQAVALIKQENIKGFYKEIFALIGEKQYGKQFWIRHVTHETEKKEENKKGKEESVFKIFWPLDELEKVKSILETGSVLKTLRTPALSVSEKEPRSDEGREKMYSDRMTLKQLLEQDPDCLRGKRVFVRCDFNVIGQKMNAENILEAYIKDDSRIRITVPDIKMLIKAGAKVILASHNDRYEDMLKNTPNKENWSRLYGLEKVAKRLTELLEKEVSLLPYSNQQDISQGVNALQDGEVLLLENLRFHVGEESKKSSEVDVFANMLYEGVRPEAVVNAAFGTAHRGKNASLNPQARLTRENSPEAPVVLGNLVKTELQNIKDFLDDPEGSKRAIAVLGGSKVKDKVKVLEALIQGKRVKKIVLVGLLAFPFLALKGYEVGNALDPDVLKETLATATRVMKMAKENDIEIILPKDVRGMLQPINKKGKSVPEENISTVPLGKIQPGFFSYDVGPDTITEIQALMANDQYTRVLTNGTAGLVETSPFDEGTNSILDAIFTSGKKILVMGGDGVTAANKKAKKMKAQDPEQYLKDNNITLCSGGGAALDLLGTGFLSGFENSDFAPTHKHNGKKDFFVGALLKNIHTEEDVNAWLQKLARKIQGLVLERKNIEVTVFPKNSLLSTVIHTLDDMGINAIHVGMQDLRLKGAPPSDADILTAEEASQKGISHVLLGYSDHRKSENSSQINLKIKEALLEPNLTPILVVGETREEALTGKTKEKIEKLLRDELKEIDKKDIHRIKITYEPIWAIGTEKAASPHLVNDANKIIYNFLFKKYGKAIADQIPLLYGGSVKERNSQEMAAQSHVNGFMVGNAAYFVDPVNEKDPYKPFPIIVAAASDVMKQISEIRQETGKPNLKTLELIQQSP
jgi:phosphoglycerate kinase